MTVVSEGRAPFSYPSFNKPTETWYQIHGKLDDSVRPLILVHGGPGMTHTYMVDMSRFHSLHGRTVIFYDQVGCGRSTRYKEKRLDNDFWTVELFVAELNNLVDHLKIREFDLLGQSWGGMLGAEYAIRQNGNDASRGLQRLVLSNSPASMELWIESCKRRRKELPRDVDEILQKYEDAQDYDAPEYQDAVMEFYKRFACRVKHPDGIQQFPDPFTETLKAVEEDNTVYFTMNGPTEFTVIGNLKTWSVLDKLHHIQVPTFVLNGEFDEGDVLCVEPYAKGIKGAEMLTIQGCSHLSHMEKPEEYCQIVMNWFKSH